MINVSLNHYKIENYFGDGRRWGVDIGYSCEGAREHGDIVPRPMGSAGGMRKIQDLGGFFDETTLVMCGEAIIDLDMSAALHEHRRKRALASVITLEVPRDQVQNYGIVVADELGRVRFFQEKPSPQEASSAAASTGIYIFAPSVLDLVPTGRPFDIGSELFPMLVERDLPFSARKRFSNWIDIGRLSDYWLVLQRVLRGEIAEMEMPGTQGHPGVWIGLNTCVDWGRVHIEGPVFIGSDTRIEAGVKVIGPTWIGHGSHLRADCTVERSVLFEYTRIGINQTASERTMSPQYCVDRHGQTLYVGDEDLPISWGDART